MNAVEFEWALQWQRVCRFLIVLIVCIRVVSSQVADAQNFDLAGTQPVGTMPASATISHLFVPPHGTVPYSLPCSTCHESSATPKATPLVAWQGSMMAHAARDPLFFAQLDLTNSDGATRPQVSGMADMCLRCHSPSGWLEGRSTNLTGLGFNEKDMFGIQCHVCHRLVDPTLSNPDPDFTNILTHLTSAQGIPPTFGNGMYVMDTKQTRRGPYSKAQMSSHTSEVVGDGLVWTAVTQSHVHPVKNSAFHRSSNLCGTCHDVSNPTDRLPGASKNDVQKGFPIERTWTEWRHSAFFSKGESGSCQSCHMSGPLNGVGFGAPCEGADELGHINDIHFHDLTGGNAFIPRAIKYMMTRYSDPSETNFRNAVNALYPPAGSSPFVGVSEAALDAGIDRVKRTLKRAAYLDVQAVSPNLSVRVTNRTGHKLPTGYPEGRRMWLNVGFLNAAGSLIAESGRYDATTASLYHDQNLDGAAGPKSYDVVNYTNAAGVTLTTGRPTKVWEGRMEFDPGAGGPHVEFHFALNNKILMDNRIPPEGWDMTGYADNRALPVIPTLYTTNGWQSDYGMAGGPKIHYDDVDYALPVGHDRVELTLYYQTTSREYVEALRDDNPNDVSLPPSPTNFVAGSSPRYSRGTMMYEVWQNAGKSEPVPMSRLVYATADSDGDGLSDGWEAAHGLAVHALGGYNDDPDGDGLSNWQEFQQASDPLDVNDPTAGGARQPVDIILVLDTSGSMNDPAPGTTTPKIEVLRDAVTLFLETWKEYAIADRPGVTGDRVGVVYFGSTAQPFGSGVLLKNFVNQWENIRNDVQMRSASGWTAMGAGLHTAIQGFTDPGRLRHVILFGNGMQNRSPMIVADAFGDLVIKDQTPAQNPDVTGNSNVTIGASDFYMPTGIKVHSIGIGVAGSNSAGIGWHKLLHDLAQQQDGKHNFITRAFDLDGVFLEDLVESLKGNSLQYVQNEETLLADDQEHTFEFPVNQSATKFSLVVSWEDDQIHPPKLELIRPDGRSQRLDRIIRSGSFYRIITHYLSDPDELPGDYGIWKLKATSMDDRQLPLRIHALLDDSELKYQFLVPGRRLRIGEPLRGDDIGYTTQSLAKEPRQSDGGDAETERFDWSNARQEQASFRRRRKCRPRFGGDSLGTKATRDFRRPALAGAIKAKVLGSGHSR